MTEMPQPNALTSLYAATYDAWNRLVRIDDLGLEDSSSSGPPATVVEYAYDGRNFRIVTKAYVDGKLDETRHFYYNNQWQCLEERLDDEARRRRPVRLGPALHRRPHPPRPRRRLRASPAASAASPPASRSVSTPLQTPTSTSSPCRRARRDVLERYRYDAYGTPTVLNPNFTVRAGGTQHAWQHLFTARRRDPATGLMHYRNRDYHPQLGRFVTRDPVRYNAGLNLFSYVGNSPIRYADPFGTQRTAASEPRCCCGARIFASAAFNIPTKHAYDHTCIEAYTCDHGRQTVWAIELLRGDEYADRRGLVGRGNAILPLLGSIGSGAADWGIGVRANSRCYSVATNRVRSWSQTWPSSGTGIDACQYSNCLVNAATRIGGAAQANHAVYRLDHNCNSFTGN